MATRKPTRGKRGEGAAKRPRRSTAASAFPDRIFALVSPRSVGGVSLFESGAVATSETVAGFASEPGLTERAANLLADAGFEVLQSTDLMINVAGERKLYESVFGTTLVAEERETLKQQDVTDTATYIDTEDTPVSGLIDTAGTRFEEVVEGVAIEEPYYPAVPTPFPPPVRYWHLDVPADVSLGCNADRAHRAGTTGRDVPVAMVDTGWQSHPFFVQRGYRVDPVTLGPGTANPNLDEHGHGTGESANVFSTAPDARLQPVKTATASGALVNTTAAFNLAAGLNPQIITNSWTGNVQFGPLSAANQALAAAVAAAVANGIIVVFAAGNGHWGFPGQHPDVISVGGVDIAQNGDLRASDYTSGFMSNVYPRRRVPDLSGLCGMRPGAQSIMLPVPEGCILDNSLKGGTHPSGDETTGTDGWAAFSGSSAATPQVAGVCALIRQACPHLTPAQVRNILMRTARDVTTGTNHPNFGNAAVAGPDTATGNGLVDAYRAVLLAKLRCLALPLIPFVEPRPPIVPFIEPRPPLIPFVEPRPPVIPFVEPRPPVVPFVEPRPPLIPFVEPRPPLIPFVEPRPPIVPFVQPRPPFGPGPGALSPEDVAELERMIIESEEPPEL
jgi:subtilisin family serine protease